MPEMIERVAKAIQNVSGGLNYDYADFCRDAARAAFKELREPTEAMCAAAEEEGTVVGCCNITAEPAAEIWQSMIDAALA